MCRNCWELTKDSPWNLPNFLQEERHISHILTPIHLQNSTPFPCSSYHHQPCQLAETCSWINAASHHSQPGSKTLCITVGLPMSTIVNPSVWRAVCLSQVKFPAISWVSYLVVRASLTAWLHVICLPSYIGSWVLFMGQGSVCFHSSHRSSIICV